MPWTVFQTHTTDLQHHISVCWAPPLPCNWLVSSIDKSYLVTPLGIHPSLPVHRVNSDISHVIWSFLVYIVESSTNLDVEDSPSYTYLIWWFCNALQEEANAIYREFPYKGPAVSTVPRRWHASFGKKMSAHFLKELWGVGGNTSMHHSVPRFPLEKLSQLANPLGFRKDGMGIAIHRGEFVWIAQREEGEESPPSNRIFFVA